MSAISDRSLWLAHLKHCTQCPTDLCDRGLELAAAVRETMTAEELWEGVWRPRDPAPEDDSRDQPSYTPLGVLDL